MGGVFIFSGISKGLDVWGTIFKFGDYAAALGISVWEAINVVGVFFLCMFEFLTGVFLLLGCFRRWAPIFAALIMAFMLPLTFWVATANPIADCGCFGDAFKISNWATFWKNVVLTLMIIWLLIYNKKSNWAITPYLQWIAAVVSGIYFLLIAWLGYYYQPLVDFRPYPEGEIFLVADGDSDDNEDENLIFVYEKDGVKKEFRIDDELPDEEDGWNFVEKRVQPQEAAAPEPGTEARADEAKKTIRIWSEDGAEDVTAELAQAPKVLYLMIPKMQEVQPAKTWRINSLYRWCEKNGIKMVAVVGGNPSDIAAWKDLSQAQYPIYTADDTAIEEVVRGNPGVVYVENNVIVWKSSLRSIDVEDFEQADTGSDPKAFSRDNHQILTNLTLFYVIIMALLMLLSVSTKLGSIFKFRNRSHIKEVKIKKTETDATPETEKETEKERNEDEKDIKEEKEVKDE